MAIAPEGPYHTSMTNDQPSHELPPEAPGAAVKSIRRDELGRLVVCLEGRDEPLTDARVARCFPWSLPTCFISIRDKEGKEVTLLATLDELDETSRAVVEEELREKVLNPRILRIKEFKDEFGVASIHAETDRGDVTFQIRGRDDVRVLSPSRALFRDADGNTYEVADLHALDASSRKHLEPYF